jgi:hypothetical protein
MRRSEDRFSDDFVINREHAENENPKTGAKSLVLVVPALILHGYLSDGKIAFFPFKSIETRHLQTPAGWQVFLVDKRKCRMSSIEYYEFGL